VKKLSESLKSKSEVAQYISNSNLFTQATIALYRRMEIELSMYCYV